MNEMQKESSNLKVEETGGLAWVTLDRPEVGNAIDPALAQDLVRYFQDLRQRSSVRAVILRGSGKNFCSGFDLNHVSEITASLESSIGLQELMAEIVLCMRRAPQPIISLVQGAACGAGMALALASDVRFLTPDARLNVAMVRVGLTGCDMGISYFLPRLSGPAIAAELMMSGRFIHAERAARTGLANEIVDAGDLDRRAEELAKEMLLLSPEGLRLTKEGLAQALHAGSLEEVLCLENRGQVICIREHMQEGALAFFERRAPRYELSAGKARPEA